MRSDRPTVAFPKSVRAAGALWILFGCSTSLLVLASQWLADGFDMGCCSIFPWGLLPHLIAGLFVVMGVRTATGSATDTLGNAVGSLLLGGVASLLGVLFMIGSMHEVNHVTAGIAYMMGGAAPFLIWEGCAPARGGASPDWPKRLSRLAHQCASQMIASARKMPRER